MKRAAIRIRIYGRTGFLSDLILSTLQNAGFSVETTASFTPPIVVILIEPRAADWAVVRQLGVPFVVAIATTSRLHESLEFIAQGADGLVTADTHQSELIRTIETVASGGSIFDPITLRAFMDITREASDIETQQIALSRRERELLASINKGHNIRETAASMRVTSKTVENTQTRLFKKIGAKNRHTAARIVAANQSWIAD